jgi:hypothetical protein
MHGHGLGGVFDARGHADCPALRSGLSAWMADGGAADVVASHSITVSSRLMSPWCGMRAAMAWRSSMGSGGRGG